MAENSRNIVICGASFGGLSAAHYFLKHTLPALKSLNIGVRYQVHLIAPSTHFYWRFCAPRICVSNSSIPLDQAFTPIVDGFRQYDADAPVLHHGEVTSIDTSRRTVTYRLESSKLSVVSINSVHSETIPYYALVLATGTKTPSPMTSLHGNHKGTIRALDSMNRRMDTAKEIVITGGGPVAVEVAGEIGTYFSGAKRRNSAQKAKIIVVAGGDRLLPVLCRALGDKAERQLKRLGVEILYNARVTSVELATPDSTESGFDTADDSYGATGSSAWTPAGNVTTTRCTDPAVKQTKVHLSDGRILSADIYIPATGCTPNTAFLPRDLLDPSGYILCSKALRVEAAGPRIYCVGDCGAYSRGGVLDLYAAVPIMGANMSVDLLAAAEEGLPGNTDPYAITSFPGPQEEEAKVVAAKIKVRARDREYKEDKRETMLVPVGNKGVGTILNWKMPSIAVYMIKGKDYMVRNRYNITLGRQWEKP